MTKIEYIKPNIFDESIILAGVTRSNQANFPPFGFTISAAKIADSTTVTNNRNALANQLSIGSSAMIFQKQVHGSLIREVGLHSDINIESDGLITSQKGVMLNISIADCAAVLFYDRSVNVVCGVHSGWKGTSLNIVGKAIELLMSKYGVEPKNLLVYISPCASGDLYEVGSEFEELFPKSFKKTGNDKGLFDNKNEIMLQLLESGVNVNNVEISPICTISNSEFHSYRRDGDRSGRMSAFIGLKL